MFQCISHLDPSNGEHNLDSYLPAIIVHNHYGKPIPYGSVRNLVEVRNAKNVRMENNRAVHFFHT